MSTTTTSKLALLGGAKAIGPDVAFKPWPPVDADDEALVLESLRDSRHAFGPRCVQLQKEFAAWNGNRFCAATNSGTAALHMGIAACDIGAGDEVITTTLSWTSTATCILHHNAIPIFVDVDWRSMHIDPAKIEAAITPKTRGILPVHYWGMAADMDAILAIARKHGLFVIEDACQAHGSLYKGKKVGTLGHCAAFSLNQNKSLSAGEGGLYVTDDEERFTKGRALMNFGEMKAPEGNRDFHAYGMGWMYRTSDLPAAFALAQLRKLDRNNAQAQTNWRRLHDGLAGTPHLVTMMDDPDRPSNGYAYVLRTDPQYAQRRGVKHTALRDAIAKALEAEGLWCNPARWLLPAHTVFQARNGYGHGSPWTDGHARPGITYPLEQYAVGQLCADTSLWIPVNSHRPPNGAPQVDAVIAAVTKVYQNLDQIPVN
jgi:dTDP-4-amino-4,6-dideoxygalactose transaminase